MSEFENYQKCDLCSLRTRYGQHAYKGEYYPKYDLFVCHTCYRNKRDGLHPEQKKKFEQILEQKGITLPRKNEDDCYELEKW